MRRRALSPVTESGIDRGIGREYISVGTDDLIAGVDLKRSLKAEYVFQSADIDQNSTNEY